VPILPRFPVIAGPTAGGKSDLAVETALLLGGGEPGAAEIISADSVQIYRGLDIGSAKTTPAERRGVPHHLIDIIQPSEPYTVSDWLGAANRAVEEIRARGRTPIVVGGTNLYIKAFLGGLFEGPDPDPALRDQLRGLGLAALRKQLEGVDPAAAERIHPNDERRTIRALEVYRQTGTPISQLQQQWGEAGGRTDCVLIGLDWPAAEISRRSNARVKQMVEGGLVEEVRSLLEAGMLGPQAGEALGYSQIVRYLKGHGTLDEAVEQIKIETRRFAKNQRTWLRRLKRTKESFWIQAGEIPVSEWAQLVVSQCLRSSQESSDEPGRGAAT